jgi:ubiquinone/menaquinone biosynthesis C-methylase UbiE
MSFDRLAPFYTWMEILLAGRRLQYCRTAWLDQLTGCNDILIAGVGHGHFLAACAKRFPMARIMSVDASAAMLHHARERVAAAGAQMDRMAFIHAALPDWAPPARSFDAIATHFFLDCFAPQELTRVVASLAHAARADAVWLVSDFSIPPSGFARQRARAVHALMYTFFRRLTHVQARAVTDPDALLMAAGFRLAGRKSAEWGLLRADHWEHDSWTRAA